MILKKTDIWYIFNYYILWLSYISMIKRWNKSLIIWIKVTDYLLAPIRISLFKTVIFLWVRCNILLKKVFMLLLLILTRYKKKDWYFLSVFKCEIMWNYVLCITWITVLLIHSKIDPDQIVRRAQIC